MKRKIKSGSGLWAYLESSGVLNGPEEGIAMARKKYWSDFRARWRKQRRKEMKEFTVYFSPADLKVIAKAAVRHKMSRTGYIKRATLSYTDQVFLIPDLIEVRRISQLLAMTYNLLQQMMEEEKLSSQIGKTLQKKIDALEHEVLIRLKNPPTLQEWIEREVRKDRDLKDKILRLLTSLADDLKVPQP